MLFEQGKIKEKDQIPFVGYDYFYLSCFYDLSTCRSIGMGVGPIPITVIWDFSDRHGLDEEFVEIIKKLDAAYLGIVNADSKKSNKN